MIHSCVGGHPGRGGDPCFFVGTIQQQFKLDHLPVCSGEMCFFGVGESTESVKSRMFRTKTPTSYL